VENKEERIRLYIKEGLKLALREIKDYRTKELKAIKEV
jgi:hypothetical protein